MTFTINKNYTTIANVPAVKDAIKRMKATYNEADILADAKCIFEDARTKCWGVDRILDTQVEVFPETNTARRICFCYEMYVLNCLEIVKFRFYATIDEDNAVEFDTRDGLHTCDVYRLTAESMRRYA